MTIQSVADYVNVGGKVDVLVALPTVAYASPEWPFNPARGTIPSSTTAYQTLWKLGELEEEVEPRVRNILNRVSGDRYGGSAGDAIEMQFLGQVAEIDLTLSRWDMEVWQMLKNNGGLHSTTNGGIPLTSYGALMLTSRSFRLLLYPNRDTRFVRNFPCCLIESDFGSNIGTKYSRLSVRVSAHRTPEGHWSDVSGYVPTSLTIGVLQNTDTTGIS